MADQTVNFNGRSFAGVVNEVKDELKEFLQTRIIMLKAELGEKMRTLKTALPMLITAAIFLGTAFLLLTLCLVGLVSVGRASPWVALVIIAREFTILGLRAAVEAGGRHLETSMLGKWKATIQFVAVALAMLRPDVIFGGAYLDEWAMVVAAVATAWSGADYLVRSSAALRS